MKFPRLLESLSIGVVLLLCVTAVTEEAENPGKALEKLQAQFVGARELLIEPLHKLNRNYIGALEKLLDSEAATGRLESSLQVKAEMEAFGDGSEFSQRSFAKRVYDNEALSRVRSIYTKQRTATEEKLERPREELFAKYAERLAEFEKSQTMLKNLDLALEAREIRENLAAEREMEEGAAVRIVFAAKGEADFRYGGNELDVKSKKSDDHYVAGESSELKVEPESVLTFRFQGTAQFRGIIMALESEDGKISIPIPRSAYKVIDEKMYRAGPSFEKVVALPDNPEEGRLDPNMGPLWDGTDIAESTKKASEWVRPSSKDDWNYLAVAIDESMIVRRE